MALGVPLRGLLKGTTRLLPYKGYYNCYFLHNPLKDYCTVGCYNGVPLRELQWGSLCLGFPLRVPLKVTIISVTVRVAMRVTKHANTRYSR